MAITYKSQGAGASTESSGAALSPLCPATVDAGDILLAHVYFEDVVTTPSTPSGWTKLYGPASQSTSVGVNPVARHWVYGRIADGSEDGAAVAFGTPAVTTMRAARVYSFAGRSSGSIEELVTWFNSTSHLSDPQMPTVRTTKAGGLAIAFVAQNDNNAIAAAGAATGGTWAEAVAEYVVALTPGFVLQIQTCTPTADPGLVTGGAVVATDDPSFVIGCQIIDSPTGQTGSITLKGIGDWARLVVDGTVAIPVLPTDGDRMFLFATWKDFSVTVTDPSGWTPIGSEFADGSVNAAASVGSVKVMAWYRDWQSGDADPTIDWSANPSEGHACIAVWRKDPDMTWDTPLTATAAMTNWTTTEQIVAASATVDVPDDSLVMGLIGFRDETAICTRPTTGIDDSTGAITWNGNYEEGPQNHFSTNLGFDMAGDLGHRFVTTGATATLRMTGTISAAETGACKWVVQGVSAGADPAIAADAGSYAITGTAVTPKVSMPADSGTYTISGTEVTPKISMPAGSGSYAITGTNATLTATKKLAIDAGSYAITGMDVALSKGRTIVADSGSYTITGSAATLEADKLLAIGAGSYTLSGTNVGLFKGRTLEAGSGVYTLSGVAAALEADRKIAANSGSYSLTGSAVNFHVSSPSGSGAYTITGGAVNFKVALPLAPGSYSLTGSAVNFKVLIPAGSGAYVITGQNAALTVFVPAKIQAASGSYSITGTDTNLIYSNSRRRSGSASQASLNALAWKNEFNDEEDIISYL